MVEKFLISGFYATPGKHYVEVRRGLQLNLVCVTSANDVPSTTMILGHATPTTNEVDVERDSWLRTREEMPARYFPRPEETELTVPSAEKQGSLVWVAMRPALHVAQREGFVGN